jgi:hypothetical protein
MPVTLQCLTCNKDFRVPPSIAEKRKYCSRECGTRSGANHPEWQGGEREKHCQQCGRLFRKLPKRAISLFREQKFCSKACADIGGFRYFGEANSKWNGNPRRKHPGRHAAWARRVISRDRATCQRCGVTGVEMHAHHVKSYIDHPQMRWDVTNGETLCYRCHWNEHTGSVANGVKSGKLAAGHAGDNPEPSFQRKLVEGVTTRGRAYRRVEGNCGFCGAFISKRPSSAPGASGMFCSVSHARKAYWQQRRAAHGSNASTSAPPERDDIV